MKPSPQVASLFRALADPTRLRLLNLLAQGELCVCYFVAILGETQPKISRHLAYLRRAGLVKVRRDGKWMHYSLDRPGEPGIARILQSVIEELRSDPRCGKDTAMLSRACCGITIAPALEDAPLPQLAGVS